MVKRRDKEDRDKDKRTRWNADRGDQGRRQKKRTKEKKMLYSKNRRGNETSGDEKTSKKKKKEDEIKDIRQGDTFQIFDVSLSVRRSLQQCSAVQ